jgi:uncharacterized OB-fold protein
VSQPLRAPLEIGFDYTRSLGPVLSQFMTALAGRRILGSRGADGRVHAPPFEYDPVTFAPPAELVEVGSEGTVTSWSWMPRPLEGQPLADPFAWALVRLDGADSVMLHAVDAGSADAMRTGMRVRVRWAEDRAGDIRDIACFEPCEGPGGTGPGPDGAQPVAMITTPVRLHYEHTASAGESRFLAGLASGRLLGERCPVCGKVYIPPRGACPTDGVPTTDEIELLDGADIPFQHLILGCKASEVRMGMRVKAVWKPRDEWGTTPENIDHFRPAGQPDARYDSYAHHL